MGGSDYAHYTVLLSLLLKWNLWLHSLHCFASLLRTLKIALSSLRCSYLLSTKLPRNFSVPIKSVCATVISLSGSSVESYMLCYPNHDVEIKKLWLVYKFLGHQNILNLHRVLGPHKILSPPRVLGPHRVLVPGSSQGSGSRFYGMSV